MTSLLVMVIPVCAWVLGSGFIQPEPVRLCSLVFACVNARQHHVLNIFLI
jgi:hypothetical protein